MRGSAGGVRSGSRKKIDDEYGKPERQEGNQPRRGKERQDKTGGNQNADVREALPCDSHFIRDIVAVKKRCEKSLRIWRNLEKRNPWIPGLALW